VTRELAALLLSVALAPACSATDRCLSREIENVSDDEARLKCGAFWSAHRTGKSCGTYYEEVELSGCHWVVGGVERQGPTVVYVRKDPEFCDVQGRPAGICYE
jgi:hypothetical protein